MNSFITHAINVLQSISPAVLWVLLLLICFSTIILFYRIFGKSGLYMYSVLSIIIANVQVLKSTIFFDGSHPIALGTLMFASGFLCTDILSEYHGKKEAQKAVFMGFAGYLLWTVVMIITVGFTPLTAETAGDTMAWNIPFHNAMQLLFEPSPVFFVAGMLSYLLSQFNDIWLFDKIRIQTNGKFLWLRNIVSTSTSALIDSIVFNILVWRIFASDPMPWSVVFFTFILGSYGIRLLIALFDTPFVYWAGHIHRQKKNNTNRL